MILYHYTTKAAYDEILRTNTMNPSDPWTTMDASYGRGWYFTDLPPEHCDAWKVAYCWRSLSLFGKVAYYLKCDVPDDLAERCRDHVYMVSAWSQRVNYLGGGAAPECGKGPCLACDVIAKVRKFFGI